MLSTESAKMTGTPGEGGWAQVHEFTPEDPEKLHARGHLFAVVATKKVEDPSALDTISAGRELIARLHEEYFGNLEAKPFNALSSAVEKVTNEFRESWGNVEIVASAIVDGVVYSVASGGGKVLICRNGAMGTILSGSDAVVSASGFPKAGDVLLMATKSFFENVSQELIKTALDANDPSSAIDSFAPIIHGAGAPGSLGVAVIKFEEKSVFAAPAAVSEMPAATSEASPVVRTEYFRNLNRNILAFVNGILNKLPKRSVYVKSPFDEDAVSQNRKLTFSVALLLLLVLAVSIGFGIRQKRINDLKSKYQGILVEAQANVDQAISLASTSPERSRELFIDSVQKLGQIEALNVKDPKIDELKKKINDSRAAILGEYLSSPDLFLDLSLLSSGFKGDMVAASGGEIYILDTAGKRLVSVSFENKKSKVVAGPTQIDEALGLASYEDRSFILMSDGIYEVGATKERVVDKSWGGDAFIKAFAGNLYVLDKSGNAIYRYQGQSNSFGDKGNWLAAGTKVDFSDATSWVIDGSVYVLYPNSKILKYSLGSPQAFSVTGVVPEIGTINAIYADADNADIYLLDQAGRRVVVTDKKGKYIAQYVGDQIGSASNLVVSEADKKIILLAGDKLFSIDIKHLQ